MELVKRLSLWIFYGLLAYMPLHIFLSTWLGTSFGVLQPAKVAKDVVLVIGFSFVLVVSVSRPWFREFLKDRLVWLIVAYGALTVLLALIFDTDQDAEILGVVYNLRFLVFFLYAGLLIRLFDKDELQKRAVQIVLGSAAVVVTFGVVQYMILPDDALTHIGYSRENGVLPAFFIDDKPDLERVMSMTRDPNSLGSYIIAILSLSLALLFRRQISRRLAVGLLTLSVLCLLFTFSRSAWIGMIVAAGVLGILSLKRQQFAIVRRFAWIGAAFLILLCGSLFMARDSYFVQNVILHADSSTVMENPNELRIRFLKESTEELVNSPVGHGPGTAGLASIRNTEQGVRLNENYYLQIGHEVGWPGLVLFVVILVVVARRLFAIKDRVLPWGLLAAFAGLAVTNMLVHIWSNEAVAYTWWGLAGLTSIVVAGHSQRLPVKSARNLRRRSASGGKSLSKIDQI